MLTKTTTARYAQFILEVVENIGLLLIGLATVVAGYHEVALMIGNGKVTLADLLLMFLYLEVLTMVGLYYNSGKLPVRFPLYIAIAVLIIRYGHVRFPYAEDAARLADGAKPQYGRE